MFKQFKDVKARDEVKQEESVLEKLITLGNEVIEQYNRFSSPSNYIEKKLGSINIDYNENDIANLIKTRILDDDFIKKRVFGAYTGCLLTKLTEARHAEGKTTSIVVDGIKQDYILFDTKEADSIVINNCEGDNIGWNIGGNVKQVIINNCKGKWIGDSICSIGNINQVIINNCEGAGIGDSIGSLGGNIEQVIINNCKGKNIGSGIGGVGSGKVNQLIINKCKLSDISFSSYHTCVKQVIITDYEGYGVGLCYTNGIINNKIKKKKRFTELMQLIDSMTGKSAQEIQDIARSIGEYSNV